jgi:excisionase family DNA binding protein
VTALAFPIPDELVEAIAERAAAILARRVPSAPRSPWLTVAEAAEYLGCGRQRVYDLKSSGRVPSAQDGTRPLFHRAVLDAYLASGDPHAVAAALPTPAGASLGDGRAR